MILQTAKRESCVPQICGCDSQGICCQWRCLAENSWYLLRRDIAPEGASLAESNAMLEKVVELAEHLQKETGKKVLWGTAQLFKHPRFMHGAATSALPSPPSVSHREAVGFGRH